MLVYLSPFIYHHTHLDVSIQDVSGARIFSEVVSLCLLFTVELCAELLGSVLVMLYVYHSLLNCVLN